jgi:hypothetical protein
MDPLKIVPAPNVVANNGSIAPNLPAEPEPVPEQSSETPLDPAIQAEVARLRKELFATDDTVVQAAIEGRLAQLGALPNPVNDHASNEPLPPLPTRAELEAAEKLIREARVEKMRGSPQKALAMVKQAAEAAPGAAIVQEALGDDLADRSQLGEALKAYRMALRLDPSNVGVERKHAALVARTSGLGSVEDQLRASLSDSFLPDSSDAMAGGLASVLFTAILPGLGHILVGKIVFGAMLLGSWIIGGIWLTIMKSEIPKIFARGQQVNGMVFVPIAIMALTWLVAVQSMTSQTKRRSRRTVDRPLPPVDMKFD